jgi:hypothetical protein
VVGSVLKVTRSEPDNRTMSPVRAIRTHLTYANVMASVALFVALGGGAYALSVPRNSVGPSQLKRNAVTSAKLRRSSVSGAKIRRGAVTGAKVRDRSIEANDIARGVIPAPTSVPAIPAPLVLGGTRAADTDPLATPGTALKSTSLSISAAGKAFVLATLDNPFLMCGGGSSCDATWGIYVDGQPVPSAGLHLQAGAGASAGPGYLSTLFGVTPTLAAGGHTVTLNMTSSGSPASVGQLGSQLGAIAAGA